jgi:16S rRNA (cytidine1402-2'-O)-methyltransferase
MPAPLPSPIPVRSWSTRRVRQGVAGLKENGFFFGGFPPAKRGERKTFFKSIATLPYPLVFYESPHRIRHCLKDCSETFGNREALLFRELTKMHEQHYRGTISTILEQLASPVKGEIVLIIHAPAVKKEDKPDNLADLIRWYNDQPGMSLKDAVRHISSDLDLPRNKVYQEALSVWKKK